MRSSLFVPSVNPPQFGSGPIGEVKGSIATLVFQGYAIAEALLSGLHINVSVDRWKEGDKLLEEILKPYASIVRPSLPHDLGK